MVSSTTNRFLVGLFITMLALAPLFPAAHALSRTCTHDAPRAWLNGGFNPDRFPSHVVAAAASVDHGDCAPCCPHEHCKGHDCDGHCVAHLPALAPFPLVPDAVPGTPKDHTASGDILRGLSCHVPFRPPRS
ncbi:MAG TPA: hypothetical protein ENJ79_09035 [Gammaproteobacteria bacterium]|nr:hypothetical protein [Gammaproteobacteria bacterium]